jgi:hypothetical protein
VWAVVLIVIGVRVLCSTRANSVYPIFSAAGARWLAGDEVYLPPTADLDVFRYSPPVAAVFAPWSLLPDRLGGLLWRGLNAAVLLGGLAAWCRWLWPRLNVPAVFLLVIPLAVGGLNNGQCNALVIGLLLIAQVAFARGRWTAAAALAVVPVLLKGYPLALGLLLCLIEPRRFGLRLAGCLCVAAALPYLCQRPEYVTEQYAACLRQLNADDRTNFHLEAGYHDLHMLVRRAGLPMDLSAYRLLEMELGLACAALILVGRSRGWDARTALDACLGLGACWMTLAGPATESSTYVLLAPVLARAVLIGAGKPWRQQWVVAASYALFTAAAAVAWFPGRVSRPIHATGLQPFAALLLTVHVVAECVRSMRNENGRPELGRPSSRRCAGHFFSCLGRSASSSRTGA